MLELRKDPVVGRWVIISTARGKRPMDFSAKKEDDPGGFCPFCPGNEDKTPKEILSYPPTAYDHATDWSLRVVPNKFPALEVEGELHRRADGIYDKMNGIGAHEVIIETPDHKQEFVDFSTQKTHDVLNAYRDRIIDLHRDNRFRYVMVFKNHGEAAGASLFHTHSQLIAMPIVPKRVTEELKGAKSYFDYKERCIFCDIVEQELDDRVRLIQETDHFLSISPYAPRFPFETWILPKSHRCFFENTTSEALHDLAGILSSTLKRIRIALDNPPYNFLIHNAPFDHKDPDSYHWHIEIMPRSTRIAGFEWGTGFNINPTPPEESAAYLRDALLD